MSDAQDSGKGKFGTLIPRPGGILSRDISPDLFPFEAFTFDPESTASPVLTLNSPWKLAAAAWCTGTAAALATLNPIVPLGAIAFETDTLSFKIGDGATAYSSLTYFYRGLPVAGEPSLGTPHNHAWDSGVAVPGNANVQTLDLSGQVPVGTKMVSLKLIISATSGNTLQVYSDSGGTIEEGVARAVVTNVLQDNFCLCAVDSARKIYYKCAQFGTTVAIFIRMTKYWA